MIWVGYAGAVSIAAAWLPQCLDTIRAGRAPANRTYLILVSFGAISMTVYALWRRDPIFAALNAMTSVGATLNAYYSLYPRQGPPDAQ